MAIPDFKDCDNCVYFTCCNMQCDKNEMNKLREEIQQDIEEN